MSPTSQPVFAGTRCLPLEDYFYRMPLVPYICPPLHPELLRNAWFPSFFFYRILLQSVFLGEVG